MVYLLLLLLTPTLGEPAPPPHTDVVGNARWMVKYCNITIVSTHSLFLDGYPFALNKDVADGLYNETTSTGVPYIYSSPLATLVHDFQADPRVSFTYSGQFTHYCADKNIDNDSPTCPKVVLSGEIEKVVDSSEIAWAKEGMFTRHPDTKKWPPSHGFLFFKLKINNIFVLDFFGGPKMHINIKEYLNYKEKW